MVTGVYWLGERFYFLPQRRKAAQALEDAAVQRRAELDAWASKKWMWMPRKPKPHPHAALVAGLDGWPLPVIAAVFVLRSFLFEPFKIPSGSMVPDAAVGDLILVNKFTYGCACPSSTQNHRRQQACARDVLVFRYPPQPSLDYIKRVVGVPGMKWRT